MALVVPDVQEVNEYALVVPQAQAINLVWWGIFACMFMCVLLAFTCFVLGWRCSSWWNCREVDDAVETPVAAEPVPEVPRTMRPTARKSKFTQCNRGSVDYNEIIKLTIDAIRNELKAFGDRTDGCKHELAERLRVRRMRNEELNAWFHADADDENDLSD